MDIQLHKALRKRVAFHRLQTATLTRSQVGATTWSLPLTAPQVTDSIVDSPALACTHTHTHTHTHTQSGHFLQRRPTVKDVTVRAQGDLDASVRALRLGACATLEARR